MIEEYRRQWSKHSGTAPDFPFGFVQLAQWQTDSKNMGWPQLRWQQTMEYGYAPNDRMKNVFMATAIDSDADLHPKKKRPTAERLAWASLNLAYGREDKPLGAPIVSDVKIEENGKAQVTFSSDVSLDVSANTDNAFSVCCQTNHKDCDKVEYGAVGGWQSAKFVGMKEANVAEVDTSNTCEGVTAVAYLWQESPCADETCPLYSPDQYKIPVAPFKVDLSNLGGKISWNVSRIL